MLRVARTKLGDVLRSYGLRRTPGRMRVLSVLRSAKRPLAHADILSRLGLPAMDRVSVYRALEAFVKAGLVHQAFVSGRTRVFETADRCRPRQCHPHFSCRTCGGVTCMTDVVFPIAKGLPKGYTVERQKISIEGVCAQCNARQRIEE